MALATPVLTAVSTGGDQVHLTFPAVTGATGYKLYRDVTALPRVLRRELAKTVRDTLDGGAPGTTYFYSLVAFSNNESSAFSADVSAIAGVGLEASLGGAGVSLVSPNGTRYLVIVANNGTLSTVAS